MTHGSVGTSAPGACNHCTCACTSKHTHSTHRHRCSPRTLQVGSVSFERQGIADHATNLAKTIQTNLKRSLEALGVDILIGGRSERASVGARL